MEQTYPSSWSALRYPWFRAELLACLEELSAPDPRPLWEAERKRGLISDIDQVIHFFFDDHDFDEADIGYTLLDDVEVTHIASLKRALDQIIAELPRGGDDKYVTHPLWP